jgi:hypothetical protein
MSAKKLFLTTALGALIAAPAMACDAPIKVGVLHSLSGTMAISETTLKDTMEMLIEQQNGAGGVLGCQLEAVVDGAAPGWVGAHSLDGCLDQGNGIFRMAVQAVTLLLSHVVFCQGTDNSRVGALTVVVFKAVHDDSL